MDKDGERLARRLDAAGRDLDALGRRVERAVEIAAVRYHCEFNCGATAALDLDSDYATLSEYVVPEDGGRIPRIEFPNGWWSWPPAARTGNPRSVQSMRIA